MVCFIALYVTQSLLIQFQILSQCLDSSVSLKQQISPVKTGPLPLRPDDSWVTVRDWSADVNEVFLFLCNLMRKTWAGWTSPTRSTGSPLNGQSWQISSLQKTSISGVYGVPKVQYQFFEYFSTVAPELKATEPEEYGKAVRRSGT